MWIRGLQLCSIFLLLFCLVADGIRLIRENGIRDNSYFYHLGDGSHAYHYQLDTATSIYFKCVFAHRLKCYGRAVYKFAGSFTQTGEHNHPVDPNYVGERHFRANVLRQVEGSRFVNFKDIVDQARRDMRYSRTVRANMNLRRLRSSMHAARKKIFPPIPQTLRELTQILLEPQNEFISKTIDETDNVYAGSVTATDGSHHVAFLSRRMLNHMADVKILQADGTFKSRPATPHSSQVFVLVTPWDGSVVPLGWILMERKSLSAYRAVIRLLKHLCPRLNPDEIISDWEYSQQVAWNEGFPNAEIRGCIWHLCRAFIKKANKLRLLRFKDALPDLMVYLKICCAIPLLPEQYFRVGLNIVREDALRDNQVVAYLLHPFFNYVEEKWIMDPYRRMWMGFFNSMHRTNNACESHNRMLRSAVGAYRPNVYHFINALAKIEHNADLDVHLMRRGLPAKRQRAWKSAFADVQLQRLCQDLADDIFHDRDTTIRNFLNRAADLLGNAFHGQIPQPQRQRQQ